MTRILLSSVAAFAMMTGVAFAQDSSSSSSTQTTTTTVVPVPVPSERLRFEHVVEDDRQQWQRQPEESELFERRQRHQLQLQLEQHQRRRLAIAQPKRAEGSGAQRRFVVDQPLVHDDDLALKQRCAKACEAVRRTRAATQIFSRPVHDWNNAMTITTQRFPLRILTDCRAARRHRFGGGLQPAAGNDDDHLGDNIHDGSGAGSVLDHHHDDQPLHVQPGAVTALSPGKQPGSSS